jgi:hypothetical protein
LSNTSAINTAPEITKIPIKDSDFQDNIPDSVNSDSTQEIQAIQ